VTLLQSQSLCGAAGARPRRTRAHAAGGPPRGYWRRVAVEGHQLSPGWRHHATAQPLLPLVRRSRAAAQPLGTGATLCFTRRCALF